MNGPGNRLWVLALGIIALARCAYGYEVETHREIARKAVLASTLSARLDDIGIPGPDATFPAHTRDVAIDTWMVAAALCIPTNRVDRRTIVNLIALGAFCEDATVGTQQVARYANHFYDPAHGGRGYQGGALLSSLAWGRESNDIASQDYSYKDARRYFYDGLTNPSESQRHRSLALTFRSIGQVIHLIQDLAQPQHTRDDSHGSGSRFERYTESVRNTLPFGGYASVRFGTVGEYWHTEDGKGLADYSNAGFVSEGTNFVGNAIAILPSSSYPKPDGADAVISYVDVEVLRADASCKGTDIPPDATGEVWFVGTPVRDNYANVTTWNPRTSTFALFEADIRHIAVTDGVFTLNRFNFCEAHKLLIPRAVGYSAGLINYFFRGQFEVSAPDEGVYAAVDHAVENQPNSGGFERVRLKVRNVTPGGTGPNGESLVESIPSTGGALMLVAKVHRNLCYQPNLSGEYGSPGVDWRVCRSPTEEIVVSETISDLAGIDQEARTFSFRFPRKIPIDATDLYLQVVYRGPLGDEPDAVAVATRDISEPTYVHQFTTADQYLYCSYGVLSSPLCAEPTFTFRQSFCEQLHPELTYDECKARYGLGLKFRGNPVAAPIPGYDPANPAFPPGTWVTIASEPPFTPVALLPPPVGSITRVAVLTDLPSSNVQLLVTEHGVGPMATLFQWNAGTLFATINQLNPETGVMTINRQYAQARGVYVESSPPPGSSGPSVWAALSDGDAPNIPNLTLVPSQILF
jgi:hypothetical protein